MSSISAPALASAPRLGYGAVAIALPCGAAAAASLPPLYVTPGLLSIAVLLALVLRATSWPKAFFIGLAFGYGYFLAGLYWVAIAFYTDAERFGALAVPAVLLLALACALFPAAACGLLRLHRWRSPVAAAAAFAVLWVAMEALRGDLFLKFPWNPISVVWMAYDPMAQPLAWIGSSGIGALTIFIAALPASIFLMGDQKARGLGPGLATTLLVGWWVVGEARLGLVETPADTDIEIRVVQANVDQQEKWDPDRRAYWFRRHLEMSVGQRRKTPDIVIWPESAVPYAIETEPLVRKYIGDVVPDGGYAFVGGNRFNFEVEPPIAHNSVFMLDHQGTVVQVYDKVDLVPFGEFLPFRWLLEVIGLEKLTPGTFDFIPGEGRKVLTPDHMPSLSPLVCYEAIFPGRAIAPAERPDWLLNITNDAWFGNSSGPYQHLAMARMRAVEEGLPLIRAANSGVSVATDALGRVRAQLPLLTAGVIDARLPAALPDSTLYRRWGGLIVPTLLGSLLILSLLVERHARNSSLGTDRAAG